MNGRSKSPRRLGDLVAELFARRVIRGPVEGEQLTLAWQEAGNPSWLHATRVHALRNGVLIIDVSSSAILFELKTFHKKQLLANLKRRLGDQRVRDLRFQHASA
jgi:predicted nucleic acid-binding Zn ribbon protein